MVGIIAFGIFAIIVIAVIVALAPPKVDSHRLQVLELRNQELEAAMREIFMNPDQAQLYASIALENSTKPITKEK